MTISIDQTKTKKMSMEELFSFAEDPNANPIVDEINRRDPDLIDYSKITAEKIIYCAKTRWQDEVQKGRKALLTTLKKSCFPSSQDWKSIEEALRDKSALEETILQLASSSIHVVPQEIGRLIGLQWIDLSCNQLWEIPPQIAELPNLKILTLTKNRLRNLSLEKGHFKSLENLALNDNLIEELPKRIGELKSLTQLNVSSNNLRELPEELGELDHLVTLFLHNNQLEKLPPQITKLTKLEFLILNNNPPLDGQSVNSLGLPPTCKIDM